MRKKLKYWLVISLPFIATGAVLIYFYSINLSVPGQPFVYSHRIHAGKDQIPCQYCHPYPAKSSVAGMPSVRKCLGCHRIIAAQDSQKYFDKNIPLNVQQADLELKENWQKKKEMGMFKLAKQRIEEPETFSYLGQTEPIPWKRVYNLPEHVHFSHKPHIQKGFECQTCHGEVEKMDVIHPPQKIEMGWCIQCHEENAKDEVEMAHLKDCLICHY